MATMTANFPELMETRQKEIFFKRFEMISLMFTKLFGRSSSTKGFEDRMRVAALGTFRTKPEGTPVTFDDPIEGARIRDAHTTYALGTRSTWEAIEDDQWNILDRMPEDLGDSARDHMERLAWSLINDGWTGTTFTGLDTQALFDTAHTLLRTGPGGDTTDSNTLDPPVDLTVTGLEDMLTLTRSTLTEEGRFSVVQPKNLLYHEDNAHKAFVLLQTEMRPGTGDNDKSTVASTRSGYMPVDPDGVPYLTNTASWSVHNGPGQNSLEWKDRANLFFERSKDNLTFDQLHWAAYRALVMFSDWRGNAGSNFV
jgi:hypothetical protein